MFIFKSLKTTNNGYGEINFYTKECISLKFKMIIRNCTNPYKLLTIMKIRTAILFCLISSFLNAQDISRVTIGMDFFLFNRIYENGYGKANYSSTGVYIEKPIQLNFIKQTFLNPGLSYKSINETFSTSQSALGGSFSNDLKHNTFSAYLKIIHKVEIEKIKPSVLYFGAFGGTHFITWARGSARSSSVLYEQANWENSDYRENPSHLFNKMYFGFLTGIQFTNNSFIEPSLELRILPLYGEYKGNKLTPFEIALNLRLGGNRLKQKEYKN